MLSKNDILKKLSAENYFIDLKSLEIFITDWKINPVFEDDNGVDFYDEISVKKIRKGITLKAQGYPDETIASRLENAEPVAQSNLPDAVQQTIFPVEQIHTMNEPMITSKTGNVTLDISTQTLQMIAEAVAKKISDDIKNSDFASDLIEAGGYKRDNEILSKQIAELLEDNKKMAQRLEALESKKSFWQRLFG